MFTNAHLQTLVPSRASACILGKENFTQGSSFISFLIMHEDSCTREDFCVACWEKVRLEKLNSDGIQWQGKIPLKKEKIKSQDAQALEFFKTAVMDKNTDKKKLYLLALYLERRKQLLSRGVTKGRQAFELIETEEVFMIEKVACGLSDIRETLQSLMDELK
jgi:hypothetical protein